MTWTKQYTAEDAPLSWTDPSDALTRGAPALWLLALETGDITVILQGGTTEEIALTDGQSYPGEFVGIEASDIDFQAGSGAIPPVLASGAQGPSGPTGPTGAGGATGPTGPTGPGTFAPGNAAHWTNPDPTTYAGAIDRIAAAMQAGTTGPIA